MKINNKDLYKTRIGGLFTILVILLMTIFSGNLFQQVLSKQNPTLLFQQQQISQPTRHDIDVSNFSLAVALLDEQTLLPIQDESIFTVSAQVFYKNNIQNQDGTQIVESGNVDLVMERCTENNFQEPQSKSYFMQLNFSKMYCIKPGQSGMFLEGQFDADRFNMIRININECISSNCKDPSIRQKILSNTDLQVYYTNSVVQITDLQQPFKRVGQTQFWKTNYNMVQQVNLMFVNQFVQDDMGLFYSEDLETKNDLAFSSERVLLGSRQTNQDQSFYQIELYMEKNVQNIYKRTYLKFPQAVSQIGGIFNVIFAFGCLFTKPYARYQLQKKIIKHSFNFSEGQSSKQKLKFASNSNSVQNKKLQIKKKSSKMQEQKIELQSNPQKKQSEGIQKQQQGIGFIEEQSFKQDKLNDIVSQNDKNQQHIYQSFNQKPQFKENSQDISRQVDLTQDKVIEEKDDIIIEETNDNLEIKNKSFLKKNFSMFVKGIQNYLKSYTVFFNFCKYIEFNFCVNKINQFTDVCTIINKQVEFQRMKYILLNQDQLSLFKQISQPIVNKSIIKMDPSISLFALNVIDDNESEFLQKSPLQSEQQQIQRCDFNNAHHNNIFLKKEHKNNLNEKILQMINLDLKKSNFSEQIYSEEKIQQVISKNESVSRIAANTITSQVNQIQKNSNLQYFNNKITSSQISESILIDSINISPQQVYKSKETPIIPHFTSSKSSANKLDFK
ncbi:hypothetical protein ABPG74_021631 [Tetrahymena malaccensis]